MRLGQQFMQDIECLGRFLVNPPCCLFPSDLVEVLSCLPTTLMKLGLATDPSKPLNEYEPLSLGSSHEDGFKEVWRPNNAATCLAGGLYEAGGVITWLNPLDNNTLPVDAPSFYQIMACEKRFVAQDYGGVQQRVMFPFNVHCYVAAESLPGHDSYPKTMYVLAGHAMVCAWWVPWLPLGQVVIIEGDVCKCEGSCLSVFWYLR